MDNINIFYSSNIFNMDSGSVQTGPKKMGRFKFQGNVFESQG